MQYLLHTLKVGALWASPVREVLETDNSSRVLEAQKRHVDGLVERGIVESCDSELPPSANYISPSSWLNIERICPSSEVSVRYM